MYHTFFVTAKVSNSRNNFVYSLMFAVVMRCGLDDVRKRREEAIACAIGCARNTRTKDEKVTVLSAHAVYGKVNFKHKFEFRNGKPTGVVEYKSDWSSFASPNMVTLTTMGADYRAFEDE